MKRLLTMKSRPRRRLASALAVVMFFSAMIAFATTALLGHGMYRRQMVQRQVLYNAELAAAESLMERGFALHGFFGQPSSITMSQHHTSISDGREPTDVFLLGALQNLRMPGFESVVVAKPVDEIINRVVEREDIDRNPDLEDFEGYAVIVSDFSVMAGARANGSGGPDRALAYSNQLNRPGVYVARRNTTYRVPLLAYAIFYENRLEIDGGADLDVVGRVHTNDDMWLTKSSGYARYHDKITVAGNFIGGLYHWGDWQRRTWSGIDDVNLSFNPNSTGNRMSALADMRRIRHNNQQTASDGSGGILAGTTVNNGWLSSWNYNVTGGNPLGRTEATSQNIDPITGIDMDTGLPSGLGNRWTSNPAWASLTRALFTGPSGTLKLQDKTTGAVPVSMPISESANPYLLIEAPKPDADFAVDENGDPTYAFAVDKKKVNLGYQASVIIEPRPDVPNVNDPALRADTANWPGNAFRAYRLVADESQPSGYREVPFSLMYRLSTDPPTAAPRSFINPVRIYNGREQKFVTLVDVDMAKMAEYLKNPSASGPGAVSADPSGLGKFTLNHPDSDIDDGIIFVNTPMETHNVFNGDQKGVPPGEQMGARMSNGLTANLRSVMDNSAASGIKGLTFASSGPMYTKGNVNEQQADEANPTKNQGIPLMIAGDSINILSPKFTDTVYDDDPPKNINGPNNSGSNTITNAVFVSGNVPTKFRQYGGGAENYFRYLEGGGRTHFYRGSIINLFESKIATGNWDKDIGTGTSSGYYGVPRRNWGWDVNYASGLPPPGVPTFEWSSSKLWELVGEDDIAEALHDVGRPAKVISLKR